ncbi:TPA: hypothetical protein ACIZCU_002446 [Legionella pneumophila]|uniref:hypothetical protein n=1 Tax=Legionella sp. PATHC039 TaxID=2992042 RepID=UPI0005C4312D|nr:MULTISPECIES: hypothetical protein [Legionella]MCW8396461.1 hypothetical protein [Legionella sp. PATHC039]MDC7848575.1 hypothetical protein [Legionella pneumophila]WBA07342.1 hypothetical protein LpnH3D14_03176 [Legionella pneumophila]GAN31439.1 hypothetical protein lpymt_03059 [Legionella pneumophila]
MVSLNAAQYRQKGLCNVLRHKSKRISQKIPLPQESRGYLDQYLEKREVQDDELLFIAQYGTRLQTLDVYRIC